MHDAIPLLLKSQFNHIAHLDDRITSIEENMVTKQMFNDALKVIDWRFGQVEKRFEQVDHRISDLTASVRHMDSKLNGLMVALVVGFLLILASPFLTRVIQGMI